MKNVLRSLLILFIVAGCGSSAEEKEAAQKANEERLNAIIDKVEKTRAEAEEVLAPEPDTVAADSSEETAL